MSTAELNSGFPSSGIGTFISSLLQEIKIKKVINICNVLFIFQIAGNGLRLKKVGDFEALTFF